MADYGNINYTTNKINELLDKVNKNKISVDITDIFNRIIELAEVQGTCTDEDYNTLKSYADNGVILYVNMEGIALHIDIQNINNVINLRYNMFDGRQDTIQQFTINSYKLVSNSYNSLLAALNMGDGVLGSYNKAASYTDIKPDDSISAAIGKLEAGIGSGGGSSDDVYYLNYNILSLKATATVDEVKSALGGDNEITNLKNAIQNNKYICIKYSYNNNVGYYANVDYMSFLGILWNLKIHKSGVPDNKPSTIIIDNDFNISIIYDKGYELKNTFYNLTADATSEEISTAIGGESGMKELIKAVKDGNNIYISGKLSTTGELKTNLISWSYNESENGDLLISFGTFGYMPWGSSNIYAVIIINYTKESNTFGIQVI